jgi:hypothetical protein
MFDVALSGKGECERERALKRWVVSYFMNEMSSALAWGSLVQHVIAHGPDIFLLARCIPAGAIEQLSHTKPQSDSETNERSIIFHF